MIDFIAYVVSELKQRRLSKDDALALIRQFSANGSTARASTLHPLLHANVSDVDQQCYAVSLDGGEFFLRDHQVADDDGGARKILPGVAYLEMARAAALDAWPGADAASRVRLADVVWLKPVIVGAPQTVYVRVWRPDGDAAALHFEIFSVAGDADGIVHCRGCAHLDDAGAAERVDLAALDARMRNGEIGADAVYAAYHAMGMRFGPAHRAVERIARGESEALARLALPAAAGTGGDYVLHPALLDGALQSAVGLIGDLTRLPERPLVPFALDSLRVLAPCRSAMVAWLRPSAGTQLDDAVSRLDIDLCDADGNVCAQLRGFASRTLVAPTQEVDGTVVAGLAWTPRALATAGAAAVRHHVWLADRTDAFADTLRAALPQARIDALPAADYTATALHAFAHLQALIADKPPAGTVVQIVAPHGDDLGHDGLAGLLRTAAVEQPGLVAQFVSVDTTASASDVATWLDAESRRRSDDVVRYTNGVREVPTWIEHDAAGDAPIAYREDGVYLVTGGSGGLGLLFAADILANTRGAKVVLAGRRGPSPDVDAMLAHLDRSRVDYREADVADAGAVRDLVDGIVAAHGRLDGVLHAAGVIDDALIARKHADAFARVLAPKVDGTLHLDAACAALDLDFFVLFSSGAALRGNPGQADYAAANGFLDGFAAHRERLVQRGERRGKSLSVNWPLWREGGMRMPAHAEAALRDATGMTPLATTDGLAAFRRSLASPYAQTVVVAGERAKIREALAGKAESTPAAVTVAVAATPDAPLIERTREWLCRQFADLFKLPASKVDAHAPLEKYGIDSILAMDLTARLEKTFGALSKTLFFEHQTIAELADHFVGAHATTLATLLDTPRPVSTVVAAAPVRADAARRPQRRQATPAAPTVDASRDEPIAIVGLAGRYPEAPDVDAYWRNLRDGRDCIVEIPAERWNWRDWYSDDRSKDGAHYSRWGGFIEGVDEFDALFFNIPPVDAQMIDPQERLFLQHAWMALEDAGYTRAALQSPDGPDGQVGVYVGVMYGEYQLFGAEASAQGRRIGVPVSYASVANRVSYVLNVHGPSMTLDSMCSSSLTAIHLACQDLKLGRTALAIAGGVNVTIHPNKYLILSAGQYISGDGHCQSFGEGGDGYIPGEGVGAVVLKRLSDAQRDGNVIYGVIRGSALNHGGKTNGYSVPNPKAQTAVVERALADAGVDPRHVSFIEAHGTGTRLGDPIEIAALTQAFRRATDARGFCAIGSAKSNIGHCESAAGIAGLTKVLLQLRHEQLVPSLHSQRLNPHIDFDATPFVVNQTLRPWTRPVVDGRDVPRIAGISSFGAGGSNAHLIVEEYVAPPLAAASGNAPALVPLSARTAEQLRQKARDLCAFLAADASADFAAVVHTLQTGREVMAHRLACVVESIAQLVQTLDAFLRGDVDPERCCVGQPDADRDGVLLLAHDDDMREAVDRWIARGKLAKLAELWTRGFDLDWRKLDGGRRPAIVSLPAYPFAKDRHWIAHTPVTTTSAAAAKLHPLVHANTSDFFGQRYTTRLSGDEFFLADHRIAAADGQTHRVLPGAAWLEMVRAAVELAWPRQGGAALELRNIAWTQPLVVDAERRVTLALSPQDDGAIAFDATGGEGADAMAHCAGQVRAVQTVEAAPLDIAALAVRMTRGTLAANDVYTAFGTLGLHYGAAFRCVNAIRRGHGEALAELVLPAALETGVREYVLHPALLDGALQAAIGLVADLADLPREPAVPFALDALDIVAPCTSRMTAWVRDAGTTGDVRKLDIDLADANGRVCVRLRGLASRTIALGAAKDRIGLLLARPAWERADATSDVAYARRSVWVADVASIDTTRLMAALPGVDVEALAVDASSHVAERYRTVALAAFERLQTLLRDATSSPVLVQLVVAADGDAALLAGLSGLIDTARLENPSFVGQLVIAPAGDETMLAERLRTAAAMPHESLLRFDGATPQVLRWHADDAAGEAKPAYRDDGVYLITGGLGGLGMLFAREILTRAPQAAVVLTGRSEYGEREHAALDALHATLAVRPERLVYRRVDLARRDDVEALVESVYTEFGTLTGVLHCAGMTHDAFIVRKTPAEFAQVLEPKVLGTFHLDQATQHAKLDFFALFSSVASALGNVGQADYAAANGFMDQFAAWRDALGRHGRTLSVHWPLWQEGGMHVDAERLALLVESAGMVPMQTASGMFAFARALETGGSRVLVAEGYADRLRRSLAGRRAPVVVDAAPAAADVAALIAPTQRWLIGEFAGVLGLPPHELSAKAPLENYGIDSVLAMKLTNQLERAFGSLSKTLFFEYQTIAALAAYLTKTFPDAVRARVGVTPPAAAATVAAHVAAPVPLRRAPLAPAAAMTSVDDDIAIVGVAGRYPQARDLATFWANLEAGRDSITQIPASRWNHAPFFHPSRNQPGKTYSRWGGFIDDVDRFDALFFNISPKEAELIDPQERLFLETAWETIENAGYAKDALAASRVGVYVGAMWGQYTLYGANGENGVPSSSFASIANRVSYVFDFHGPSLALDTMCSSSLTAIHLACEDLRKGSVDVALAGGVNVSIHPNKYLSLAQGNFASTDGRCRSFGAGGDGYVPGEGVGAVLLKPLRHALRDGDRIHAVIRASAINHGGKTNGYTVPNPVAQADLIRDALDRAQIDPATLGYVETHGTGTSLGDPIEVNGLVRAFADAKHAGGANASTCAIGSVKSNIGHLESAAGIAALTKVLLQLEHGRLVPSLHADTLNPHIDFDATPLRVQRTLADWPKPAAHPRRAAVSSFGAGGANAHLVVEEFVAAAAPAPQSQPALFVLSAKHRDALRRYAQRMLAYLDANADAVLADVAYTSQVGRTAMTERLAIVASDVPTLAARLRQWIAANETASRRVAVDRVLEGGAREVASNAAALIDGDAGRSFVQSLLERRDHDKLAQLWTAGVDVDWALLHGAQRRRRLALPTYPFSPERYWIDTPVTQAVAPATQAALAYYSEQWQASPLSARTPLAGPLLLVGADDVALAAFRRAVGDTLCTAVRTSDDAVAAIDAWQVQGTLPAAVVHIAKPADDIHERVEHGVHAVHAIVQALLRHRARNSIRLVCAGADTPSQRALGGYLRSLTLENPAFAWKCVALDGDAAVLVDEVLDAHWHNADVRHVRAVRQTRSLQRIALSLRDAARDPVRQRGVYLITGGLGGLGRVFADHLASRYGARLVLTGRSPLDTEGQRVLDALRDAGGEAIHVQADVADAAQAAVAVQAARAHYGRIDGVIHSAGVQRDAFALHKSRRDIDDVIAAKVFGTCHLDRATQDDDLDLFVLCSSAAGAFGNAGQCDYAYANAFLDAFAAQRARERGGRTLSIGWPLWQGGGMQLSTSDAALLEARSGIVPMPTPAGIDVWETLLAADLPHAVALYGDTARIDAALAAPIAARVVTDAIDIATDAATLREATERYLATLLGTEIKLPAERIDTAERFEAYGVDSMMIARINAVLERDLGELPKTLFYEYATIAELSAYLVDEQRAAVARHLGVQAAPAVVVEPVIVAAPIAEQAPPDDRIAIIGVHVKFPQSETLDAFWQHLANGSDLIGRVPADRWNADAFYDADPERARDGKIYCAWGGFVDDVAAFDAAFFGVAADEARVTDPQERLFLQSAWAAVEDAGYTRDSLKARHPRAGGADVGVFVGVTTNTYQLIGPDEARRGNPVTPAAMPWSIANRVSYWFDFQGPSLPIDTACSSSLVAMHQACASLRRGECQVALAGGVNLYLHPAKYQSLCRRRMLAVDGKCRSYGAGDDGFIPGEGVGTLVLKPLAQAIADGDHVYGVIAGSACEHAGRSNGYSAPNPNAQARVIGLALDHAGIDAATIGYVEGHGTGTQLGDNLEVVALTQAFAKRSSARGTCALGSVKTNLGHAESAAGIAGVAKVLAQFKHRQFAPTLHARNTNPDIDFAATPFFLQHDAASWHAPDGQPRRALVNGFGAGGVNACVVLEEFAPQRVRAGDANRDAQLVVLSAKNGERLRELASALLTHLGNEDVDLSQLAYTLQTGRESMEERFAVVVPDLATLRDALTQYVAGTATASIALARVEPHQRVRALKPAQREQAAALFSNGELHALAALWLQGHELPWRDWYGERHPARVPLPTYPFARERHWAGDAAAANEPAPAATTSALHPLVSHNISTLKEIGFASTLSSDAYYARDHQVHGQAIFPGAGYLEIACVAGALAGENAVARIEDIVWMRPLPIGSDATSVRTFLRGNGGDIDWVATSLDDHGERIVHAEGRLCVDAVRGGDAPRHAIDDLKRSARRTVSGDDCYRRLESAGFRYGPTFRTIRELCVGDGYVLARLELDAASLADFEQYVLHPCLVDGALQSLVGMGEGDAATPYLPFALGAVELRGPLPPACYALVTPTPSAQAIEPGVRQFDIRLLNDSGDVLVALDRFYVRALRAPAPRGTSLLESP
jgi:polyketide synthase PksN